MTIQLVDLRAQYPRSTQRLDESSKVANSHCVTRWRRSSVVAAVCEPMNVPTI